MSASGGDWGALATGPGRSPSELIAIALSVRWYVQQMDGSWGALFIGGLALLGLALAGCGDPSVPTIAGGTPAQVAAQSIADAGLVPRLKWKADSAVSAGEVVSIDPQEGTSLPPGSDVTLTASSGSAFSMEEVVDEVDGVNGASEVDPDAVLNSSVDAAGAIPVGNTPRQCTGIEPTEVERAVQATGGDGSKRLGVVVLKMPNPAAARSAMTSHRRANAACVAVGNLTWQNSSSFVMAGASSADWRGYPAYMSAGALTSMATGAGQGFRSVEVAWSEGKYIVLVRLQEDTGPTFGTMNFPKGFASIPPEVEAAAGDLSVALSRALAARQRDARVRAATQRIIDRIAGVQTGGSKNRPGKRVPETGTTDRPASSSPSASQRDAVSGLETLPARISLKEEDERIGVAMGISFWSPSGNVGCRAGYANGAQRVSCTRTPAGDSVEVSGPAWVPPQEDLPNGKELPAATQFFRVQGPAEEPEATDWVLESGASSTLDLYGVVFVCSAPSASDITCEYPAEGLSIRQGESGPNPSS